MKTAIDSLKKTVKKYRHAWVLLDRSRSQTDKGS